MTDSQTVVDCGISGKSEVRVQDNIVYLPEQPATGLTGDARREAWAQWWADVQVQRRAGVIGKVRRS